MTDWALGLDGGGTRTRAAVAHAAGPPAGRGGGGPCNLAAMPLEAALESALAAAGQALAEAGIGPGDVRAVCAGVAGVSFAERRAALESALARRFPQAVVRVEPDYAAALSGATGGRPGVVVIAGTGSVAYGENAAGARRRTGAYGYLIDDGGSGYGVGRAALAAALRAEDGTGAPTSLRTRVPAALELAGPADLVPGVYGGRVDRVAIAALSRQVAAAAREDRDAVARAILRAAAGELARLALAVAGPLFGEDEPFPLAMVGGLWDAGPALAGPFRRMLRRSAPGALPAPPLQSPVEGALARARRLIGSV